MKASLHRDVDASEPLFLGVYPLTHAVQCICIVHAVLCVFVISTTSSVVSIDLGPLIVSPALQVACSAWCVLGISIIAGAVSACRAEQELPLKVYFYYWLVSTAAFFMLWWHVIGSAAYDCKVVMSERQSQRLARSQAFTCLLSESMWLFAMLVCLALAGVAANTIWQLRELLRHRDQLADSLDYNNDPLVRRIRKSHSDRRYGAESAELPEHLPVSHALEEQRNPRLGQVPAWGQVPIEETNLQKAGWGY